MARMRITGGDGGDQLVELQMARVRIGRGRDNDIVLPGPEKGVSRAHAELRFENGHYVIVDLQSQNGTWVNGRRVERAEAPYGAEIAVGAYRLTLLDERPLAASMRPAPRVDPLDDMRATERHDRPIVSPAGATVAAHAVAPGPRGWVLAAAAVVILGGALATMAWMSSSKPGPQAAGVASPDGLMATPGPAAASDSTTANGAAPVPGPSGPSPEPAPVRAAENGSGLAPRPADGTRITRRPGESVEAWRGREAALQTRYGYSKAALDRGDYAAAAGGFEAILLEEPGFRDAARLLVQAQAGLRASARSLLDAGSRLDQAGDWMGALQKYEQARQVHAALPGLAERIERARAKLRAAGAAAFKQGRQHEAEGRPQDALKEYEKAVQWLPADDPDRLTARSRIEHLKRND